jgi:zinc transporter ZupT
MKSNQHKVMTTFTIIAIACGVALSALHLFSHYISRVMEEYHYRILSFSGGTLIALIFLVLLPEVIATSNDTIMYLLMLLGFTLFHLTEKFLYQHVTDKKRALKDLKILHELGFFVDHFILGFVLVTTLQITSIVGYIILIPIFLHTISSSITMEHIDEKAETSINRFVLSTSSLLGVIAALLLTVHPFLQAALLSVALGMLLYIVNRDILPKNEKGYPLAFVVGALLVTGIWAVMITRLPI